ncbi:MAG: hypothetical protein FJZ58_03615 [Chlamydiae bacterium]|nr:hypothetical protein [Chlamydiota bacterium]
MKNSYYFSLLLSSIALNSSPLQAGIGLKEEAPNPNDIQVVPVERTVEPDNVNLRIQYPEDGDLETKSPVHVEMRLDWFPLGVDSEFPRKNELYNDHKGQSIHVFIDDREYFEINEALFDALDDHEEFFDQTAEFDIPFPLTPGPHIIRAFPCRSFGESLKSGRVFAAELFYFQKKGPIKMDFSRPYLTYNEPQGNYFDASKPILLDFFIKNCTLSMDGYKVRLTIDNANQRFLYSWSPYYIYGLPKGTHTIRLELIDPQNNREPGVFNDVTREITIR